MEYIDPVFGPPLAGPEDAAAHLYRATPAASLLVNVTFRVNLRSPAAEADDTAIRDTARSLMMDAVRRAIGSAPGAAVNGDVQVSAQLTRL